MTSALAGAAPAPAASGLPTVRNATARRAETSSPWPRLAARVCTPASTRRVPCASTVESRAAATGSSTARLCTQRTNARCNARRAACNGRGCNDATRNGERCAAMGALWPGSEPVGSPDPQARAVCGRARRAADNVRQAMCNMQQATDTMQRATCDMQPTPCNVRQTTCNRTAAHLARRQRDARVRNELPVRHWAADPDPSPLDRSPSARGAESCPGAGVSRPSRAIVPVQMWQWCADSVSVQMWAGVSPFSPGADTTRCAE